jgi:hypothetical protein
MACFFFFALAYHVLPENLLKSTFLLFSVVWHIYQVPHQKDVVGEYVKTDLTPSPYTPGIYNVSGVRATLRHEEQMLMKFRAEPCIPRPLN